MKLEAKVENPLLVTLDKQQLVLSSETIPLKDGAVFGGDHYGFSIISKKDGEETTETYPTQCRIYGIQMDNDQLYIFEDHKYLPWKFSSDGTLISSAVFSTLKRDEIAYVAETYGVTTEEELAELNNSGKVGRR